MALNSKNQFETFPPLHRCVAIESGKHVHRLRRQQNNNKENDLCKQFIFFSAFFFCFISLCSTFEIMEENVWFYCCCCCCCCLSLFNWYWKIWCCLFFGTQRFIRIRLSKIRFAVSVQIRTNERRQNKRQQQQQSWMKKKLYQNVKENGKKISQMDWWKRRVKRSMNCLPMWTAKRLLIRKWIRSISCKPI